MARLWQWTLRPFRSECRCGKTGQHIVLALASVHAIITERYGRECRLIAQKSRQSHGVHAVPALERFVVTENRRAGKREVADGIQSLVPDEFIRMTQAFRIDEKRAFGATLPCPCDAIYAPCGVAPVHGGDPVRRDADPRRLPHDAPGRLPHAAHAFHAVEQRLREPRTAEEVVVQEVEVAPGKPLDFGENGIHRPSPASS